MWGKKRRGNSILKPIAPGDSQGGMFRGNLRDGMGKDIPSSSTVKECNKESDKGEDSKSAPGEIKNRSLLKRSSIEAETTKNLRGPY